MTPLWLDAAGRPRPTRASMRLKATAWLVGSVGLIIALSGGAQEALPSPAMLSTRLDTLQLAFADELNKPLLEQSLARLRTIAADIDALAREVAFAVRTSDSTRVIGYVGVQEGLKPVHARITLYVSGLQARQESELREKQRSEEVWPQFWAEQEAWQQRRAIEEQREQEREREKAARRAIEEQRTRERTRLAKIATLRSKGWPADVVAMILDRQVRIGMTADHVREAWGTPQQINTTTTQYGQSEQWVYGVGQYLYFENGLLTAIQQARSP